MLESRPLLVGEIQLAKHRRISILRHAPSMFPIAEATALGMPSWMIELRLVKSWLLGSDWETLRFNDKIMRRVQGEMEGRRRDEKCRNHP